MTFYYQKSLRRNMFSQQNIILIYIPNMFSVMFDWDAQFGTRSAKLFKWRARDIDECRNLSVLVKCE